MTSNRPNPGAEARKRKADEFAATLAPVIREIQVAGITSLHGIAAELNQRRIRGLQGGLWFSQGVGRLLARRTRLVAVLLVAATALDLDGE